MQNLMNKEKNADETTKSILNKLQQNGLDIMMCTGQAYDNASTMAGVRTGVQRRIKDINSKALFIPCGNHLLNLAGVSSIGCVISQRYRRCYDATNFWSRVGELLVTSEGIFDEGIGGMM